MRARETKRLKTTILLGVVLTTCLAAGGRADPPAAFTVKERFGVSHPEQIIEFDLDDRVDAGNTYLLGPEGSEVPYQLLDSGKKLAVRTDLPKGAEKSWRLMSGRAPQSATDGVTVKETETHYEIANGLIGVRVAKPVPAAGEAWKPLFDPGGADPGRAFEVSGLPRLYVPAPVQGVLYRDGTWSGIGPNGLAALAATFEGMEVTFRERGPLKTVVEATYRFTRPEVVFQECRWDAKGARSEKRERLEGGPAYYRCTIEVQAGQPSILFEEETDTDLAWSMDLYAGLKPTTGRYRGHHAGTPEAGHGPDGKVWATNLEASNNAQVDLRYDKPSAWRRMAVWDPWIYDGGWWWQVFDDKASATGNLLGIFAGRASRALGAMSCGTSLFTLPPPRPDGAPRMGLTISLYGRVPPVAAGYRFAPLSRYQWGLFLGVKGQDVAPQTDVQPINRQMNLRGGINLNKIHRLQIDFPDPASGYGSIYMDAAVVRRLIERVRTDEGFYRSLRGSVHVSGALVEYLDFWRNATGTKAQEKLTGLVGDTAGRLNTLINGNGIYDKSTHYYEGGWGMVGTVVWADQLLATGQLTDEETVHVKALAVVNAAILWDDDHTPRGADHGLNFGNANMPTMHSAQRETAALYLATHPMMAGRLDGVWPSARQALRTDINADGAHMSAVGYVSTVQAMLQTLLALQNRGLADAFRDEPRLEKFAEFYMNLMTPAECRFGGERKMVPIGDSSTDSTLIPALLGTGFATLRPELSAQLMGAWASMGSPLCALQVGILAINQDLPIVSPRLRDGAFPGYYSALRHGCDTPDETAVWCVNGNTYGDHAHNDLGSVIVYALGAPLSMDWSGRYPSTKAGSYHSTIIEEKHFGSPWDKGEWVDPTDPRETGGAGLSGHSGYVAPASASQEGLLSLGSFARIASRIENRGLVWRRVVTRLNGDPDVPLILIEDAFDGEEADQPKIFTMNLMADGAVQTPAGEMTPTTNHYYHEGFWKDKERQAPSAGSVFDLDPGVHRLSFTGQAWPKHPTQGIDWDLYLLNDTPQKAHIGNWAIFWQPSTEQTQFKQANGRPYEERQHILRVRGTGEFTTLLVPWRKGGKPADLRVERDGGVLRVLAKDRTTTLAPDFYTYQGPDRQALAALSATPVEDAGIRTEGGPTEVALAADHGSVTVHGAAGKRTIELPGSWRIVDPKPSCPARFGLFRRNTLSVRYAGGDPVTVYLHRR